MKKQPQKETERETSHQPVPFDDALRRILNAPRKPKKAKEQESEKAKKK